MPKIEGFEKILLRIGKMRQRAKELQTTDAAVSYGGGDSGCDYAIYVHEDLTKFHLPPTQAKFLEQPARTEADRMRKALRDVLAKGGSPREAFAAAGYVLYRASQELVPVDKGVLKQSGRVLINGRRVPDPWQAY